MLSETVNQTRRRLLKITGYSLLMSAHGLAFGHTAAAISSDPHTPLMDSMKVIGEAYLERYPTERSRSVLLGAIQSCSGMPGLTTGEPVLAALSRQVTEDFRTDEVVYLNGWALSRTEARVAALTVV